MSFGCSFAARPRLLKTCSAYCPAGTVRGLPTATRRTASASRSGKELIWGAPVCGVTTTSSLRAKSRRVSRSIKFLSASASICCAPALAKTSTGAAASICFCSAPDAPKLKLTCRPVRASYNRPISRKASRRDAPADTVISPPGAASLGAFALRRQPPAATRAAQPNASMIFIVRGLKTALLLLFSEVQLQPELDDARVARRSDRAEARRAGLVAHLAGHFRLPRLGVSYAARVEG